MSTIHHIRPTQPSSNSAIDNLTCAMTNWMPVQHPKITRPPYGILYSIYTILTALPFIYIGSKYEKYVRATTTAVVLPFCCFMNSQFIKYRRSFRFPIWQICANLSHYSRATAFSREVSCSAKTHTFTGAYLCWIDHTFRMNKTISPWVLIKTIFIRQIAWKYVTSEQIENSTIHEWFSFYEHR